MSKDLILMIEEFIDNCSSSNLEFLEEVSNFLKSLNANCQAGHYVINEKSYANIDIYDTKPVEKCRFEAHKKYIDIQMTLEGFEELDYIGVPTAYHVVKNNPQSADPNSTMGRIKAMLENMIKEGKTGREAGEGFYKY